MTKRRRLTLSRFLRGLLIFILGWGIIAWVAARSLIVHAELASADVIVVLSGSSAYRERTQKAAELYTQGRAPLVLLTNDNARGGWSSAQQRNPYFVERATDELIRLGVPAEKIRVVPGVVSSTRDESELLRNYAREQRFRSVLVVTSPYHSRRALWSFRRSFANSDTNIGLEPALGGSLTPSPAFWWLQPAGWRNVGGEYLKLIYYWFKYG